METIYDVDYFIKKFENIIDELWTSGSLTFGNKHCSLGHCGVHFSVIDGMTQEAKALVNLFDLLPKQDGFRSTLSPITINDGHHNMYTQYTPKERILAALYDIKAMQQPKERVVYKTVVIDSAVKELQEILNEN